MSIVGTALTFARRDDHLRRLSPGVADRDPKSFAKTEVLVLHVGTRSRVAEGAREFHAGRLWTRWNAACVSPAHLDWRISWQRTTSVGGKTSTRRSSRRQTRTSRFSSTSPPHLPEVAVLGWKPRCIRIRVLVIS